jgi:hypothetical protein
VIALALVVEGSVVLESGARDIGLRFSCQLGLFLTLFRPQQPEFSIRMDGSRRRRHDFDGSGAYSGRWRLPMVNRSGETESAVAG